MNRFRFNVIFTAAHASLAGIRYLPPYAWPLELFHFCPCGKAPLRRPMYDVTVLP